MIVIISCFFNIGLDLLFVGVFHWGGNGAAIATVISQAISVFISIVIILRTKLPFEFNWKMIRFNHATNISITKIGSPIVLQDFLVSLSFLVVTAIINSMGVIASAGIGIADRLCGFIMLVPSTFMQTMSAFTAQNFGAKEYGRAKKAMKYAMITSFSVGILLGYLGFFHGDLVSLIFSRDDKIINASWEYLKAYSIDCVLVSFLFCFIGYYNGAKKTQFTMWQGIAGAFAVRIPLCFLFHHIDPNSIFMVGLASPCSTVVQIILCVIYWGIFQRKLRREENISSP